MSAVTGERTVAHSVYPPTASASCRQVRPRSQPSYRRLGGKAAHSVNRGRHLSGAAPHGPHSAKTSRGAGAWCWHANAPAMRARARRDASSAFSKRSPCGILRRSSSALISAGRIAMQDATADASASASAAIRITLRDALAGPAAARSMCRREAGACPPADRRMGRGACSSAAVSASRQSIMRLSGV
eukprot:scaffold5617_cov92-Isochrysis_galbana.AAC.2